MKTFGKIITFSALIGIVACKADALDVDMARFTASKKAQTTELAGAQTNKIPSIVWSFFDAVRVDDWETATNLADRIQRMAYPTATNPKPDSPVLQTAVMPAIAEIIGAYEDFHDWDNKLLHQFGSNIITSIPKGSIYFGGTDPGRFLVSALSESHRDGLPFFTLTQNQLADGKYLEYLRAMYGKKLYIPSLEDSQKSFQEYVEDAGKRLKAGKLKLGEDVHMVNGQLSVSRQVAVMEINGLLVKTILEKNPDRQFYVEESFPLDWMYPQLSPHGEIMELHHSPLTELDEETTQKDYTYWKRLAGDLVGDWITDQTSVKEVCDFADKVYLRKDLTDFKGDMAFAKNQEAQKAFSKLRVSIAGLYTWRMEHAKGEDEKNRMRKAADLAWRQAIALCPFSVEAAYRYSDFLVKLKQTDDAIRIAETCLRLNPDNPPIKALVRQLRNSN